MLRFVLITLISVVITSCSVAQKKGDELTAHFYNLREAKYAQSKADFVHKLTIALKEANETDYWLDLLHQSHYLDDKMYHSIQPDIDELLSLLIASTKTAKKH